jgi:hypothetical protein
VKRGTWLAERLEKQAALAAPVMVRIGEDGALVVTQKFDVIGGTWWLQKFARENGAESNRGAALKRTAE